MQTRDFLSGLERDFSPIVSPLRVDKIRVTMTVGMAESRLPANGGAGDKEFVANFL